jgi:hypothetical protein
LAIGMKAIGSSQPVGDLHSLAVQQLLRSWVLLPMEVNHRSCIQVER